MTQTYTTPLEFFTIAGATTPLAFPHQFDAEADLKVYEDGVLQTLGADYTTTGVLDPAGGTVVPIAATVSSVWTVVRQSDLDQTTAPTDAAAAAGLDTLTRKMQELEVRVDRSMQIAIRYDIAGTPNYDALDGRVMNVATPTDDDDAASKSYVDDADTAMLASQLSQTQAAQAAAVAAGLSEANAAADAAAVAAAVVNGFTDLTADEITQLKNINASTISATEWGYVASATAAFTSTLETKIDGLVAPLYFEYNGDANVGPARTHSQWLLSGTITAERDAAVLDTDALIGDEIRIVRTGGGAFDWVVKDFTSSATLTTLEQNDWCTVVFDGTAWELAERGTLSTTVAFLAADETKLDRLVSPNHTDYASDADNQTSVLSSTLVLSGTITAQRSMTLLDGSATDGDRITISRTGGGAFDWDIDRSGPVTVALLAQNEWATFVFNGTIWELETRGSLVVAVDTYLPLAGGTMTGGVDFGSVAASAPEDLSDHLDIRNGTHGISATANQMNIVVASSSKAHFYRGSTEVAIVEAAGTGATEAATVITREKGDFRYATAAQGTLADNALPIAGGSMTGGLDFGSVLASPAQDPSDHISLWGTSYGFSVTASNLNYISGGSHRFLNSAGVTMGQVEATGTAIVDDNTLITAEKGDFRYGQLDQNNAWSVRQDIGVASNNQLRLGTNTGGSRNITQTFYDGLTTQRGFIQALATGMVFEATAGASLALLGAGVAELNGNQLVTKADTETLSITTDIGINVTMPVTSVKHSGTLTTARSCNLQVAGAVDGDTITVTRTGGGAFNLNVTDGFDASILAAMVQNEWCRCVFNGTEWILEKRGSLTVAEDTYLPIVNGVATGTYEHQHTTSTAHRFTRSGVEFSMGIFNDDMIFYIDDGLGGGRIEAGRIEPQSEALGSAHVLVTRAKGDARFAQLTGASYTGSIDFGSTLAATNQDLSDHIALWGSTYGFSVTTGSLNYVCGASARHTFVKSDGTVMARIYDDGTAIVQDYDVITVEKGDFRYMQLDAPLLEGPLLAWDGVSANHAIQTSKYADLASATTLPFPDDGNYGAITGTTTITGVANSGLLGSSFWGQFTNVLTLTNSATLVVQGGKDFTSESGDWAFFTQTAGGPTWQVWIFRKSGLPVVSPISHFQVEDDGTTGQLTTGSAVAVTSLWATPSITNSADFSFTSGVLTVLKAGVVEFDINVTSWNNAANRHELHVQLRKNGTTIMQENSNYASRDNTEDEGAAGIFGFKLDVAANDTFDILIYDVGVAATIGAAAVAGQSYISATLYKQ